jgi:hypothetical protein
MTPTAQDVIAAARRLAREALFLLVFGSGPGIKTALLHKLGAAAG